MDARVVQEAAGPGRFILGFGTSKIFLNNAKTQTKKTLGPMRDAVTSRAACSGGERFDYDGDTWSADVPAMGADAHAPREVPPVYVAATAPKMQQLAGEIADGCLTPSITTPDFVRYSRGNVGDRSRVHGRRLDPRDRSRCRPRRRARDRRDVSREQGAEHPGLGRHAPRPRGDRAGRDPSRRGGDGAGRAARGEGDGERRPPRQVPPDRRHAGHCIAAIEEYKDAGCSHVMLELWGDDRHEQIRLSSASRSCRIPHVNVDRERLVETASRLVELHSFTGDEQRAGRARGRALRGDGPARAMAAGRGEPGERSRHPAGAGGGKSLMFNGHLDTSYSGREPWLRDVPGFQPKAFVEDGRLYGLGISNMKGAVACYLEAVRALQDAGIRLRGDVLIAAVCGEIEKTQYGDAQGAEYRGYAAGSRYLVSHGGVA